MAQSKTLISSRLISFSRDKHGLGTADFACPLTQPTTKAMEWGEFPDWLKSGRPGGEINGATTASLVPTDKELKRHAIDLAVSAVYGFEIVTLEIEGKRDKGTRHEVRYKVDFCDPKGARKLEEYRTVVGDGKGNFTVSYVEQTKLDLPAATQEQMEAVSEEED